LECCYFLAFFETLVLNLFRFSAPKAAGVKSATTTTAGAPVQPHPSSAAAVFLSTVAVACTVFLAL
jgi:hypothetical protein